MAVIARIAPGPAAKVGMVLYGVIGLIIGILVALFSMLAGGIASRLGSNAPPGLASAIGIGGGVSAIIVMPIIYGVIGAITFGLSALITIWFPGGLAAWKLNCDSSWGHASSR